MKGTLSLRLPEGAKQRIKDAAASRGQTITEFVKAVVLDRADEILRQRDVDAFAEFLASCPEDDEPYTEEQQQHDLQALEDYRARRGTWYTHEEIGEGMRKQAA